MTKSNKNNKTGSTVASSQVRHRCDDTENSDIKLINVAIQGGGAHGAFAWGVLDRLLEEERLKIEGISGASAGSMNAVVLAYGLLIGGREGAKQKLYHFWRDISISGQLYNPAKRTLWEQFVFGWNMEQSPAHIWFEALTRWFSPYQLNPYDFNPMREVVLANVNFAELQRCPTTKLFLSTTNVRTGQVDIFRTDEITVDTVMASACLPNLYKAVEIDGEYYWDGGYTGNPALFPFFYQVKSSDILMIHINPIERPAPPTLPNEIFNRVNEISFNSGLLKEFRAIAFVKKLLRKNMIKDEFRCLFKDILLHAIGADAALIDLSAATKSSPDWDFLIMLRNRGRAKANEWLSLNLQKVGVESSFNLRNQLVSRRKKDV